MKIQAIVPLYPDPLMCELYVRNFVKYKKKYVDRLIILVKEHQTTSGRTVKDDNGNVIAQIEYGRDNFKRHIESLKKLLAKHNITNYKLVDTLPDVEHGVMFHHVIDDIRDENYHTLFDEQDAYWLNDDFEQISSQLSDYDVIGGEKSVFHFLKTPEHLELFNKKHGLNHTFYPQKLHLPEFLSNRIIKRIDNFCCKSKWVDAKLCVDHMEFNGVVEFDTFQSLNLQIYKLTDKIKLYEENRWDALCDLVTHGYEHHNCNMDLDKHILYHCFSISAFAWATLFRDSTKQDLTQNFLRATLPCLGWELKTMMQYQFFKYHCLDFEYRNEYMSNFDKIQTIDLTEHDSRYKGELFNLEKYDCSKLIERMI
jgi:hypothetical protein